MSASTLSQPLVNTAASLFVHLMSRKLIGSAVLIALSAIFIDNHCAVLNAAEPIKTLNGHEKSVRSVEFSPDGKRIVSCSSDLTARIWDVASGEVLHTLDHGQTQHRRGAVYNVSVSPVGGVVATASGCGGDDYKSWNGLVRLWDIESGNPIATFPSQQREVFHVDFSEDGTKLVSGGADGVVRVWDVASRKILASFVGHQSDVWVVAFCPDGNEVASASFDGTVKIWNIEANKLRLNIEAHPKRIEAMAYSPDGDLLATGSRDKSLKLWDAMSGDNVATISGHTEEPWCLTFSPDGEHFASAAQDHTIRIWDTESATEKATLLAHTQGVQSVNFSPDGKTLVSSANDHTVRLWDVSRFDPEADRLKQQLDETVPELLANFKVPGVAIGVIRRGEIAFIRTYGLADKAAETPVSEDTMFNVGSVSKIATAWGVMQLVEKGQIELDEPISNYLDQPDFRASEFNSEGITARRLLSHTAGLSMHSIPGFRIPKPLPTLVDLFQGNYEGNVYAKPGSALQLVTPPGSKWQYSGGGTMILQMLIEETTGSSFDSHMRKTVLHPLNMKHSRYGWSEEISSLVAVPYSYNGRARKTYRFTGTSGAGLYSTIGDMSRLAGAGLKSASGRVGRGVLNSRSVAEMYNRVRLNDGTQCRCGLGYFVDPRSGATPLRIHHDGSNYGWRAELVAVPESSDAIVILSNSDNANTLLERIVCLWGKATLGVVLPQCDQASNTD